MGLAELKLKCGLLPIAVVCEETSNTPTHSGKHGDGLLLLGRIRDK